MLQGNLDYALRWTFKDASGNPAAVASGSFITYSFYHSDSEVESEYGHDRIPFPVKSAPLYTAHFVPVGDVVESTVGEMFPTKFSTVINVVFAPALSLADADIVYGSLDCTPSRTLPHGITQYYPGWTYGDPTKPDHQGDVWLSALGRSDSQVHYTLIHETGHTLGLKDFNPKSAEYLAEYDSDRFSVMSYNAATPNDRPYDLQLHDIAALQYIHGPADGENLGSTIYDSQSAFTLSGNADRRWCIWDAGGDHDRFELSALAGSQFVDLRPGHFSSIGERTGVVALNYQVSDYGEYNVSIAYGAIIEDATGGPAADVIIGNAYSNVIEGGDGADILYGDGTIIDGNPAPDADYRKILKGGVEAAHIDMSAQSDVIRGGAGNDLIYGGSGANALFGDDGNDVVVGLTGADTIRGGKGDDQLLGGFGNDVIYGDEGNDIVHGGAGDDQLWATSGEDELYGDEGADTLHVVGVDKVKVAGGAGDDIIDARQASPGSEGYLYYPTYNNVEVDFGYGDGHDTILYDNIPLAWGPDRFFGTTTAYQGVGLLRLADVPITDVRLHIDLQILYAYHSPYSGNYFVTGEGDAKLELISTGDTIDIGEVKIDLSDYARKSHPLIYDDFRVHSDMPVAFQGDNAGESGWYGNGLSNLTAIAESGRLVIDSVKGTPGNDELVGDANDETMSGGDGDDLINGGGGNDTLSGDAGVDTVSYAKAGVGVHVDLRITGPQDTGAGVDTLSGFENVLGSGFGDALSGDDGANVLTGGGGKDSLTGGQGSDTFHYDTLSDSSAGTNSDVIADFASGADHIDLSGVDADTTLSGNQAFTFIGAADFSSAAGQLRIDTSDPSQTLVLGDVNGDGTADFQIDLTGSVHVMASDFLL